MTRVRKIMIAPVSVINAILVFLYNDWMLAPLLNPHASAARTLISELSARTQPNHHVFQLLDICAGVLTLCLVPYVWQLTRKVHARTRRGLLTGGFAFVGVDSIVDALLPTNCAPSMDAHCSYVTSQSMLTTMHMFESTLAGVCVVLIPLLWWWVMRKSSAWLARMSLSFVGVQLAVGLTVLAVQTLHLPYVGILHRVYESAISLWMASLVITAAVPVRVKTPRLTALEPATQEATD